ncbi:hypothetical protein QBC34DRAFT_391050 [Podospora aff. communis PSN243]|uniref:Uncharacterized protein n=1 Tax=Podospora aff. communis PSN243 TaxID=3040156 RepID=A0AAV9H2T4_9PEZI|nr:hypothetical protein QBC34DRAFT_391050 [Podospora aff. communis PSN243]
MSRPVMSYHSQGQVIEWPAIFAQPREFLQEFLQDNRDIYEDSDEESSDDESDDDSGDIYEDAVENGGGRFSEFNTIHRGESTDVVLEFCEHADRYCEHVDRYCERAQFSSSKHRPGNVRLSYEPQLLGLKNWEVPGTLDGVPVDALPDWGSSVDAISEEFARKHEMEVEEADKLLIRLPGGSTAESYGRVMGRFQFQGETQVYERCFRVLRNSVHDMVLGRPFLDMTKTLTDFSRRIVSRIRPCVRDGSRLFLLDESPLDRIRCSVNGIETAAFPDTGSDLMLVSGSFARQNNFHVHRQSRYRQDVQLIDGSVVRTDGMVLGAELSFDGSLVSSSREVNYYDYLDHSRRLSALTGRKSKASDGSSTNTTFICDFHVIESLPCDIILSNEFIFKNQVFSQFKHLFFSGQLSPMQGDASILDGEMDIERCLLFMRLKRTRKSWFRRQSQQLQSSDGNVQNGQTVVPLQQVASQPTWEELWEMEERRRNMVQLWMSSLPEPRRSGEQREEWRRREDWDRAHPRLPVEALAISLPVGQTSSGP